MALLVIGYDLNRPGQTYTRLAEAIKSLGGWWHHLDSTWLVRADMTPRQVHDRLAPYLDANDELLVFDVTGRSWWSRGFPESALNWLHANNKG